MYIYICVCVAIASFTIQPTKRGKSNIDIDIDMYIYICVCVAIASSTTQPTKSGKSDIYIDTDVCIHILDSRTGLDDDVVGGQKKLSWGRNTGGRTNTSASRYNHIYTSG